MTILKTLWNVNKYYLRIIIQRSNKRLYASFIFDNDHFITRIECWYVLLTKIILYVNRFQIIE